MNTIFNISNNPPTQEEIMKTVNSTNKIDEVNALNIIIGYMFFISAFISLYLILIKISQDINYIIFVISCIGFVVPVGILIYRDRKYRDLPRCGSLYGKPLDTFTDVKMEYMREIVQLCNDYPELSLYCRKVTEQGRNFVYGEYITITNWASKKRVKEKEKQEKKQIEDMLGKLRSNNRAE